MRVRIIEMLYCGDIVLIDGLETLLISIAEGTRVASGIVTSSTHQVWNPGDRPVALWGLGKLGVQARPMG
jgi:hypothetical protein